MISLDSYTESDVVAWLGQREVVKGRAYLPAVSALECHNDILFARVRGTRSTPYTVNILMYDKLRYGRILSSHCSCPVGGDCKHVAATLLAWLAQRDDELRPRAQVLAWIDTLRGMAAPSRAKAPAAHGLRYLIRYETQGRQYTVTCFKARLDRQGQMREAQAWNNIERALDVPPAFVSEIDADILRLMWAHRTRDLFHSGYVLPLAGRNTPVLLEKLAASGRAHIDDLATPALVAGKARPGRLEWRTQANGRRAPVLRLTPAADLVLPVLPPWYVDGKTREAGPVELVEPTEQVVHLLRLPPLSAIEAELVSDALAELTPALPIPLAHDATALRVGGTPVPVLRLDTLPVRTVNYRSYPHYGVDEFDYAVLAFRYGPVTIGAHDSSLFHALEDGGNARVERDAQAEEAAARRLARIGFTKVAAGRVQVEYGDMPESMLGLAGEDAWPRFTVEGVDALRAEGWIVEVPFDFRHHAVDVDTVVLDVDEEYGGSDNPNGWLDVTPGIEVAGRPLALAPLLVELFARDSRWLSGDLERIDDAEPILLRHEEFGRLRIAAARLKPLVRALVDLFDGPISDTLRVSPLDATRLADLGLSGRGGETLAALAARLRNIGSVTKVVQPKGFRAELRPYQLEGLAWLQHLVHHNLAGILADDMGLGKTAQTLAHLLTEKNAKRLDVPALVVLPTSLVFNWQAEAERFAPALKVVSLRGTDRHARFDELDGCDIALTTYPLLWRDAEALQARQWSLLILDEAQTVKNVASKGAQVIRGLRARHRLGLTGTPLENHLGELWTQFDFLLPGFLGSQQSFTRTWRTPIEKNGDMVRRDLLAARLKPFILRRRKEDVAKELPPKTTIVRSVSLDGGQRDLYETVRAAMDDRIRYEIASKGYARSRIVILDALLKLRQVCCDPRLLKSPAAAKVKERAKLDLLMDMLPELIDEGRRILVFSQFTQMLALIATELDRAKIGWVSLTGDTYDRRAPVEDFQKGRAPVFLISLKAGGVGLNLTAADTVIHYDPWWNPAAENQATDRAHRIGQDKPVFVFKLICAGSIEERILALQERKAALAAGILSEDADALAKFGEADIAALLAPLPPD